MTCAAEGSNSSCRSVVADSRRNIGLKSYRQIAAGTIKLGSLAGVCERTPQPKSKAASMKQKLLLQRAATLYAALTLSSLAVSAFAQEKNPDRNAYFGEEHIHTSWSVDAWLFGNRVTGPDDALKYAQGETIKHPLGYDIN